MKTLAVAIIIALFLGCTGTPPQSPPSGGLFGPIDCKNDSGCITAAINNNCQDAHMEALMAESGYFVGSSNWFVTVQNKKTFCKVEAVQTNRQNQTLAKIEQDFKLPLEKCGKNDDPQSYVTVDGECEWFGLK